MLFFLIASILAQNPNPVDGQGIALESATSFCLMIPKDANATNIAAVEKTSISACQGTPAGAKPAKPMPVGLILSAHYVKTNAYSQITGQFQSAAYGFDPNDYGTQLDDSLRSQGGVLPDSGCVGFGQYLEYISGSIYCLRCCNFAFSYYCNPSDDTAGCSKGIPGDYGLGFTEVVAAPIAPIPVPNYLGCSPKVDTCASQGFVCCQSASNTAAQNNKTTCQYSGDCSPGTYSPLQPLPPLTPSSRTLNVVVPSFTASTISPTNSLSVPAGSQPTQAAARSDGYKSMIDSVSMLLFGIALI